MIFVSLALLGFGVADLIRWTPERVGLVHAVVAASVGAGAVMAVAAISGVAADTVLSWGAVALAVLLVWSAYDLFPGKYARPEYALALVVAVILVLLALSGSADPVGGDLATWYGGLGFGFTGRVLIDQFMLGVGAALFALGTGNRLVRFTLLATEASLLEGEETMRGGRVLGPIERLIVAAAVVSGGIAGAGFVVAAKGLLRFREIRPAKADQKSQPAPGGKAPPKVDEITEYFLIGTFVSVLIAGILALLVLAAG